MKLANIIAAIDLGHRDLGRLWGVPWARQDGSEPTLLGASETRYCQEFPEGPRARFCPIAPVGPCQPTREQTTKGVGVKERARLSELVISWLEKQTQPYVLFTERQTATLYIFFL